MAGKLVFVLVAALCVAGAVAELKNLHVKYALWGGFFDMPKTLPEITEEGYVQMSRDEKLNVGLYSHPHDPRVSILVDEHGNIAGLRLGFLKDDVGKQAHSKNLKFPYSFDDKPIFTSGEYWGRELWSTSVLFVSPEKLKTGGRKDTGGLVAEDVYLKLDGHWTKISKDECKIEAQGFTKQACFMGMGMHYFYKVTPDMDCGDFQGVFVLYESGKLIGLGFNPFGSFTTKDREWFEEVPAKVVKDIVPNGPQCMEEWVRDFGVTSFHIFFKRFPRLTVCTWPWQKSDRCAKQ